MKKILLMGLCLLCLCGCGIAWKSKFQVSDIEIEAEKNRLYSKTNFYGNIKNISDNNCDSVYIKVELKSGNFTTEETLTIYDLKSGETKEIDETISEYYEGYSLKIKNIYCY